MMKPYQERVIVERDQLQDRLTKLNLYLESDSTTASTSLDDLILLIEQRRVMTEYLGILQVRVKNFNE